MSLVGEMLPWESWSELPDNISGVYVLFDSSETARYVGISNNVRERLGTYFQGGVSADDQKRQLTTSFSVFMVAGIKHARELESLLIHVLGPALFLNKAKQRKFSIRPNEKAFEPGTLLLRRKRKEPITMQTRSEYSRAVEAISAMIGS
ncbi:MAG TPA: GIY-YIG nuclease family protein [Candidatus Baltobacteraceae bacterium]